MATESYTILRRTKATTSGFRTKSLDGPVGREGVDIIVEQLDERQAAEARRNPDVILARGFGVRLIRPMGSRNAAALPVWGLDAVGATSSPFTGTGVVVAVLDTGIDKAHEAFAKVNVVEADFSGSGDGDRDGHGTHCAGIICGGEVGGRRIGVAPGVSRALVGKIIDDNGDCDSPTLFKGIRWALAEGAQIISMSIGFDFPGEVAKRVRQGWELELATSEALDGFRDNLEMLNALMGEVTAGRAFGLSPLVVAAAGNESKRLSNPDWRVSASLPAAAVHLSVAALAPSVNGFDVAPFSNSKALVAAPGVDIVSARPGGGLIAESGTSMACPYVAGVAALWAEKVAREGNEVDARTLESHIRASASRDRLPGCDVVDVGRGLVRAPQ